MVGHVTNIDFSGSTLCTVVLKGRKLYAANIGNSKALLITAKKEVLQLTQEQRPSDPKEYERITLCGGRVHPR